MFSLDEISKQLKNVSRKSVGVSFAGQSLILDTADNGKTIEFFLYIFSGVFFTYAQSIRGYIKIMKKI